ncbi:MAG: hypothetical protein ACJATS_001640 [Psychroserpens sp.]
MYALENMSLNLSLLLICYSQIEIEEGEINNSIEDSH